ncbi:hypothetical protein ID866_9968 [Astraeus odoratus]|nr:hypothetical protein ID866_9968 [Astraeus odoratus]
MIANYKAKHAVLANQFIHYIIVSPVCTQTVRTSPREVSSKGVVWKKQPLLFSNLKNNSLTLAFKYQFLLWKTRIMFYGHISPI